MLVDFNYDARWRESNSTGSTFNKNVHINVSLLLNKPTFFKEYGFFKFYFW